jgi:hypothetical protein
VAIALSASFDHGDSRASTTTDLLDLVRTARGHPETNTIRDLCCEDHDGGTKPDDGLLTLNTAGEHVRVVVIYEDSDGSGSFTPGDLVRYASSTR